MNDVQSINLEMFQMFTTVCEQLNLRYYLVNGSALGARKYEGFIEWDDDIDVAMPRTDYKVFCEKAQSLLPNHIFVQNYKTDKDFPHIYTKLRNSKTTFIETSVQHLNMNHGIWIDVFPIDGYPDEKKERRKIELKLRFLNALRSCTFRNECNSKVRIRKSILRLLGVHRNIAKINAKIETIISNCDENTTVWMNYGAEDNKRYLLGILFGNGRSLKFEGVDAVVPEKIEEYLNHLYGDWRAELPLNKQVSHHEFVVCDTNLSYKEWLKNKKSKGEQR